MAEARAGHVRVNGSRAKPAAPVRAGDRVVVRKRGGQERIVEVVRVVDARVSPSLAAECLLDRTPVAPPPSQAPAVSRRERGSGRPSKRERRELDRMRRRSR